MKKNKRTMKDHSLPKATEEDFKKKADYHERAKSGLLSDQEHMEYLNFMNSRQWFPEFFDENGKPGIRSVLGKILVPPLYEDLICFTHTVEYLNVVPARKNGKWGLVAADGSGTEITEFLYDYIATIAGPKAVVKKNDKWGYLGLDGNPFTPIDFDMIIIEDDGNTFVNGISAFRKEGRYGITDGNSISKAVFDEMDIPELGHGLPVPATGNRGTLLKKENSQKT